MHLVWYTKYFINGKKNHRLSEVVLSIEDIQEGFFFLFLHAKQFDPIYHVKIWFMGNFRRLIIWLAVNWMVTSISWISGSLYYKEQGIKFSCFMESNQVNFLYPVLWWDLLVFIFTCISWYLSIDQIAKCIQIVMSTRSALIEIKLDMEKIRDAELYVDANVVKQAILVTPKLKLKHEVS